MQNYITSNRFTKKESLGSNIIVKTNHFKMSKFQTTLFSISAGVMGVLLSILLCFIILFWRNRREPRISRRYPPYTLAVTVSILVIVSWDVFCSFYIAIVYDGWNNTQVLFPCFFGVVLVFFFLTFGTHVFPWVLHFHTNKHTHTHTHTHTITKRIQFGERYIVIQQPHL